MKTKATTLYLILFSAIALSQKTVYIPLYLQDPNTIEGSQFTWDKTYESDDFIIIWGETVGTDPANYPDPDLQFDPVEIANTMEFLYEEFYEYGFLNDAAGTNLSLYKVPIIMLNTWGPGGQEGWAYGGSTDGIIGAFWVHPLAMQTGDVAAHEFTHSLQAQCDIDTRIPNGLGYSWIHAGIFWETHANFMRNLIYPQDVTAWGMDVYHYEIWGDWKNTYENYPLLMALMEIDGIDIINRMWRESLSTEYPLQAYKRLSNYDQNTFNNKLFSYAQKMATYDFPYNNLGTYFRQWRLNDLSNYLPSVQRTYTILEKIEGTEGRYIVPIDQAPEEFAYNIIPLYPESPDCPVIIKFKGHTEANVHTGWRYGFVAEKPDGTVSRYGDVFYQNTKEIGFKLEGDETRMYLVVMGAPFDEITTTNSNDTWKGYPKHFRFPYELHILGAVPEGFQDPELFRIPQRTNGHLHSNGGGWVQNSANVASSVYVGPHAMVLGSSNINGNVRIENTAIVKNVQMSENVQVLDNAFIIGGNYSGDAIVQGSAFVENSDIRDQALIGMRAKVSNYELFGAIEVGGDVVVYNENGSCDNGVYYVLTNYYENNLLACDGRDGTHPTNVDVNSSYDLFSDAQMAINCDCESYPDCLLNTKENTKLNFKLIPNPTKGIIAIWNPNNMELKSATIYDLLGRRVAHFDLNASQNGTVIDISNLANSTFLIHLESTSGNEILRLIKE